MGASARRDEGMPQNHVEGRGPDRTKIVPVALGVAMAALALTATYSAARAGDDEENLSFTEKFMRTLGLKNPGEVEYGINYSERSPLVVPPNRNLPPPIAAGPPPIPDWPKDPDIKKRQEAKNDDKPIPGSGDSVREQSRVLRPDELNVGRAATGVAAPGTGEQSTPDGGSKSIFSNMHLFSKKEEYATFTGEPSRANLTDPPPGYRTPSPDQPYGIVPEHKPMKPSTLSERLEPVR
jgi:hypothetical protein